MAYIICDLCGYEGKGDSDRERYQDVERHQIKEHFEKDDKINLALLMTDYNDSDRTIKINPIVFCPILSICTDNLEPCKRESCGFYPCSKHGGKVC